MCSVFDVTVTKTSGVDDAVCGGIYNLVDDIVAANRPVYMKGDQYRYLYYHQGPEYNAWVSPGKTL